MLPLLLTAVAVNANEYVSTPHGRRLRKCVHHAPSGSIITPYDGYTEVYNPNTGSHKHYPHDPDCDEDLAQLFPQSKDINTQNLQDYENWIQIKLTNDTMGNFTGVYSVPSTSPEPLGQLLYYFIGIGEDSRYIIQPVVNYCGGASYDCSYFNYTNGWAMEPWNCCPNSQTWHGDSIQISTGIDINAWMYAGPADGMIVIGMNDATNNGAPTTLTVNDTSRTWDTPIVALEQYNVSSCTAYGKGGFNFTKMELVTLGGTTISDPDWLVLDENFNCNTSGVVIVDPLDVFIYGSDCPSDIYNCQQYK